MTSSEHVVAPDRPHQGGWGEPASRAQLWRIADDLRRRAGFGICAIEVRRSDDMMEFVAIATDDPAARELEGQSSPLDAMYPAVRARRGRRRVHVRALGVDDPGGVGAHRAVRRRARRARSPARPSAWHPQDMLVARLVDAAGRLRAFVYFDVPDSRRRPTRDDLVALGDDLDVGLQAVITTDRARGVRRRHPARDRRPGRGPLGGQPARPATSCCAWPARSCIAAFRAAGARRGRLRRGAGHAPARRRWRSPDPPLHPAVQDSARACWARQRVLLVDGTRVWGDDDLDAAAPRRAGRPPGAPRAGARWWSCPSAPATRCSACWSSPARAGDARVDRRRELGGPRRRARPGPRGPQRPCLPARAGGGRGAAPGRRLPRRPHRHPRPRAQEPDRGRRRPRRDAAGRWPTSRACPRRPWCPSTRSAAAPTGWPPWSTT